MEIGTCGGRLDDFAPCEQTIHLFEPCDPLEPPVAEQFGVIRADDDSSRRVLGSEICLTLSR